MYPKLNKNILNSNLFLQQFQKNTNETKKSGKNFDSTTDS